MRQNNLDFAAATKNCKKGTPCGNSCISVTKTCKKKTTPAQKKIKQAITSKVKAASAAKATTSLSDPIKVNDIELDKSRSDLINSLGVKTVEAAEKNIQKIFNSDDTSVFIRVGSSDTLEKVLGDRFKTSAELGTDTHQIPYLKDGYQKARNRVESKTLNYGKDTAPEDRPIYGYMGGNNLKGASHSDVGKAYGSIAIKLKPEVKDRTTFTGADSFKSGIASQVKNSGTPPPPSAASLVSSTRHGYDRGSLPKHYPSYYSSDSGDDGQLKAAAKAKTIDALAPKIATTGNAYIEAQVHGKVTSSDIAEIHFTPTGSSDSPSLKVAKFAKDNNVKLFVDGKSVNPDTIIKAPKSTLVQSSQVKHKPFMTEAEADEYVKGSKFANVTLFHGTGSVGADSITSTGVDISKNRVALYGQGFYLGDARSIAEKYASSSKGREQGKGMVLSAKVKILNPFEADTFMDIQSKTGSTDSVEQRERLIKKGYDGVHSPLMGYYIAFHPEQVAVFKKDEL